MDATSPQWPPHLLDETNQIILPVLEASVRTINLAMGQQVTIGCIGQGNVMLATGLQLNPATCTAQSTLLLRSGEELSYNQLGCQKQNKETLVENGACANGPGTTIRVGWTVGQDFVPLFEQCHDEVKALNYFSTNTVFGKSAAADDKANDRPSFSQDVYFPGTFITLV